MESFVVTQQVTVFIWTEYVMELVIVLMVLMKMRSLAVRAVFVLMHMY